MLVEVLREWADSRSLLRILFDVVVRLGLHGGFGSLILNPFYYDFPTALASIIALYIIGIRFHVITYLEARQEIIDRSLDSVMES